MKGGVKKDEASVQSATSPHTDYPRVCDWFLDCQTSALTSANSLRPN